MRVWHQDLIEKLPSKKDYKGSPNQLGGQHTELRMMISVLIKKGKLNHSTVNYVNEYSDNISRHRAFGLHLINEMLNRKFNVCLDIIEEYMSDDVAYNLYQSNDVIFYNHHTPQYLEECLDNLISKGVNI